MVDREVVIVILFAKRLKAFADVGLTKFTRDKGLIESNKCLNHALRMFPII